MKTFYKRHTIEVNATPLGGIVFDIFDARRQHLLAGYSFKDGDNEQTVANRMKERVDQFILEDDGKYFTPALPQTTFVK